MEWDKNMSKEKSIKKNAAINALLQIANIIFPLITFPYVSRVLLVEANGRLNFCANIISYFTLFATLGLSTYGIKAVARRRNNKDELSKTVQELLIINIFTTVLTIIALILSILFIPRFNKEWILLLIYSVNIILNVAGLSWLYTGLEEFSYITKRSIVFKFLGVLLMFVFVHSPDDYIIYAIITVFSTAGNNVINIIYSRKYIYFRKYDHYNIRQHIKPTLAMFSTALATNVYSSLDTVMIGFIINDYEVGIYTAAVKIRVILATLVTSVGTVLLPRMSYYVANKQWDEFKRLIKKSYETLIMFSLPTAIYFMLAAKPSIMLLSGTEYMGSILPMQILMPVVIISSLVNITGLQILIPTGGEWKYTISVVCGALVDLVLNFFMIPQYGAVGAAIATLIAEVIEVIIQIIFARKYIKGTFSLTKTSKVVVASLVGAGGYFLVNLLNLNTIFSLLATSVVFFGLYAIILFFTKYEAFEDFVLFCFGFIHKNR